jgi:hypothetical protein
VSNLKLSNYFIDFRKLNLLEFIVEAQHKVLIALERSSITKSVFVGVEGKGGRCARFWSDGNQLYGEFPCGARKLFT